ncbi:hypothetical protein [Nostoc sp.]|uniref:hypothetical protein n=1 Tax=Nostoc sp. TaxID=1180 RepID=UPI002FF77EA3
MQLGNWAWGTCTELVLSGVIGAAQGREGRSRGKGGVVGAASPRVVLGMGHWR